MSLYKILNPIGFGGRIERGEIVELPDEVAENYGPDYVTLVVTETETEVVSDTEGDLTKLTVAQLRIKAGEMGLTTTGTKADLIDRITLALAGDETPDEDEDGEEGEVTP